MTRKAETTAPAPQNELVEVSPEPTTPNAWSAVRNLQEAIQVGQIIHASNAGGLRNAHQAVLKILCGMELGFAPMASLMNVHLIPGQDGALMPSIGAMIRSALVKSSPKYDYEVIQSDATACELAFYERSLPSGGETRKRCAGWEKKPATVKITWQQAHEWGWTMSGSGKKKTNWWGDPTAMLFARVIARGQRQHCLAGETEVITSEGIRCIRDLAGTTPQLLVPIKLDDGHDSLSGTGCFVEAPVQSFGVQKLWEIRVRRARQEMTIRATAEHRWPLENMGHEHNRTNWKTTATLEVGDRLRGLRRAPISGHAEPLLLAIMQGFTFGDGCLGTENRPAFLDIHHLKIDTILPLFTPFGPTPRETDEGKKFWRVNGLPRTWKALPDLHESRPFLLGWLAGYFAADGTVGERGHSTISSAVRNNLVFVRTVCSLLGIRTGGIITRTGHGYGNQHGPSEVYELALSARDLADSFHLLPHHRARVAERGNPSRNDEWMVLSVAQTEQAEEVFCATVEGIGAFALAGDLMTGNCPDLAGGLAAGMYDEDEMQTFALPESSSQPLAPQREVIDVQPEPTLQRVERIAAEIAPPPEPERLDSHQLARINELIREGNFDMGDIVKWCKARDLVTVHDANTEQAAGLIKRLEAAFEKQKATPEPATA